MQLNNNVTKHPLHNMSSPTTLLLRSCGCPFVLPYFARLLDQPNLWHQSSDNKVIEHGFICIVDGPVNHHEPSLSFKDKSMNPLFLMCIWGIWPLNILNWVFWISSCSQMQHNTCGLGVTLPVGFPRSGRVLRTNLRLTRLLWCCFRFHNVLSLVRCAKGKRPALVYISWGGVTNNIEMFVRSFEWWMAKCYNIYIYRGCIGCGGE